MKNTIEDQIKFMENMKVENEDSSMQKEIIKTLNTFKKHLCTTKQDNSVLVTMSHEEWKQYSKQRKF